MTEGDMPAMLQGAYSGAIEGEHAATLKGDLPETTIEGEPVTGAELPVASKG